MSPRPLVRLPDLSRRPGPVIATFAVVALLAVGFAGFRAEPVAAAVFPVSTTVDGGAGSLRDAVAQASASAEPNEIVLEAGATYDLDDCTAGHLHYTGTDELTITGNGATIRQTCANERVLESDAPLIVTDATILGGDLPGGLGGGIEADTSSVTLVRSTVTGNEASIGGGVAAIRVTLVDSTIAGNTASSTGGGIWADQTATITNSTVAGNTAGTGGGGILVANDSVTLLHATVAGNTAPVGANIQVQAGGDEMVSFGSVVANPLGGGEDCDLANGVATVSQGSNFSTDASCGLGGGTGDLAAAGDPVLGALGDNGGPTHTMLPGDTSPLIDGADCAAAPTAVTADQRGIARPQGTTCDIGAVEVEVVEPPPTTTTTTTTSTVPPGDTGPTLTIPATG
jgi:hypothetical protein